MKTFFAKKDMYIMNFSEIFSSKIWELLNSYMFSTMYKNIYSPKNVVYTMNSKVDLF